MKMAPKSDGNSQFDAEAEEYASHGIVSPTALKAARWLSRLLWVAMSGLVVFLLYSVNQSVPRARLDELQKQHEEGKAELKKAESQVSEMTGPILAEASRLGLVQADTMSEVSLARLLQEVIDAGKRARLREEADALQIVELVLHKVGEAARNGSYNGHSGSWLDEYRKAEAAKKAEALALVAWFSKAGSKETVDLFYGVAVATTATLAERVIAIRWLGEKCTRSQSEPAKVLEILQGDAKPLVASEAKRAFEGLK